VVLDLGSGIRKEDGMTEVIIVLSLAAVLCGAALLFRTAWTALNGWRSRRRERWRQRCFQAGREMRERREEAARREYFRKVKEGGGNGGG
jgi:peptidoglycan/LPS O-acetylase OafA/YrhL